MKAERDRDPGRRRDPVIDSRLRRFRRSMRLHGGLEGTSWLALAAAGASLAAFVLDNLINLPAGVRLAAAIGLAALALWAAVAKLLVPLFRPLSDERVAVHFEQACPELDNHLINAVQLSREPLAGLSALFAGAQIREAASCLGVRPLSDLASKRRLVRLAAAAVVCLAAFLAYGLIWRAAFWNALERYAHPYTAALHLEALEFLVRPGDVQIAVGEDLQVQASTKPMVEVLQIITSAAGGAEESKEMEFRGGSFTFQFHNVQAPFAYRAAARGESSRSYQVKTVLLPRLENLEAEVVFPAYTGIPPRREPAMGGLPRALKGSRLLFSAAANKVLKSAELIWSRVEKKGSKDSPFPKEERISLELKDGGRGFSAEIEAAGELLYGFRFADADGLEGSTARVRIGVEEDQKPEVQIPLPGQDRTVAEGEVLKLRFSARDDWGVRRAELLWGPPGGAPDQAVKRWDYAPGSAGVIEAYEWDLAALKLKAGATISYRVAAEDGFPERRAFSPVYVVKVVTAEEKRKEEAAKVADVIEALRRLIVLQKEARRQLAGLEEKAKKNEPQPAAESLARIQESQVGIRSGTLAVAASLEESGREAHPLKTKLSRLAAGDMVEVVKVLREAMSQVGAQTGAQAGAAAGLLEKGVGIQDRIIADLEWVLAELTRYLAGLQPRREEGSEGKKGEPELNAEMVLKKIEAGLEQFIKEQELVVVETEKLRRKPVDDFTEADKKSLEDLIGKEAQWSKAFRDAKDDLSRIPPGDFTGSALADELVELYAEIEKAAGALEQKNFELAVPLEQSGVELAKEIVTNMEKWLPNTRDTIRWNMEDPPFDIDVPLANLPEELEDLIGDLIEDQEELAEEVEDFSSLWADSIDKGNGWAVDDGPISNWSAVGKTGNRLPNNSEITGRSGEGRTGRAHGQFVESGAEGKGGRKTPMRLTPDAYEEGVVKDKAAASGGGATGGGKLSGGTSEGLRGEQPPSAGSPLPRLAQQQIKLFDRAEKINHKLIRSSFPNADMARALVLMGDLSKHLHKGEVNDFAAKEKVAVTALDDVKRLAEEAVRVHREKIGNLPRRFREEILSARQEKAPEEYRELVREYYKMISE